MTRTPLIRLGVVAVVAVAASVGAAAPANAAAETGTITGHLTTSTGQPIAAAQVEAWSYSAQDYLDGTTTADGSYTIPNVPVGRIKLLFRASGLDQWSVGKDSFDTATVFTLTSGQTLTVDERLAPTGTITGQLTDAAGAPAADAHVAASTDSSGTVYYGTTDENGRYSLLVRPGSYRLEFDPSTGYGRQWAHEKRTPAEAEVFQVDTGNTVVVDEQLLPTGDLAAHLVDFTGKPEENATVKLYVGDLLEAQGTTDEYGNETFFKVPAGDYTLSFALPNGVTQWAHGKFSQADADPITVRAGEEITVEESLAPTGSIAGRFTDQSGHGMPNTPVTVRPLGTAGKAPTYTTLTGADGDYRIDRLPVGRYVVKYEDVNSSNQYAYGKRTSSEAAPIAVRAGTTTTVNDRSLTKGKLTLTATDAKTGAKVQKFCVSISLPSELGGCTKTGTLTMSGAPGRYDLVVEPDENGPYLKTPPAPVTLVPGKTVSRAVKFSRGGTIKTTVTDRATGKPVPGICVTAVTADHGALHNGVEVCSNAAGKVQTKTLAPGTYNLFAVTPRQSVYGHQWIGKTAGTGDQREAATVKVIAGKAVTGPTVKLDKAGSVSGTVTAAGDGKPIHNGNVAVTAWDLPWGAGDPTDIPVAEDGRYTLDGLGPYQWPLLFTADGLPRQWSGGTGNRLEAQKVKVTAGATTTYDSALQPGITVSGTVTRSAGLFDAGALQINHAITGDPLARVEVGPDRHYTVQVMSPGPVKVWYSAMVDLVESAGWYGGADEAHATRVPVPPAGPLTLDLTIG